MNLRAIIRDTLDHVMKEYIYTIQYDIQGTDDSFKAFIRDLKNVQHVTNIKTISVREVSRVQYPVGGAEDTKEIVITFASKVSKDRVEGIVDYWNSIGYVRGVKSVNWTGNVAKIEFDANLSRSHDINARKILEQLLGFLEDGTPVRNSAPYGRAFHGIGKDAVLAIVGR